MIKIVDELAIYYLQFNKTNNIKFNAMQQTNFDEEIDLNYCRAGSGKRLANYIIDLIAFYVMIFFIAILIELAFPLSISENEIDSVVDRILAMVLYAIVMFVIEAAFQGKSLGKLITGTRAVNINGEAPTFTQLLQRNFLRAVPFNALSALGSPCVPWHDRWSDTYVVDEKVLELQKRKDVFFSELSSSNVENELSLDANNQTQ